MTKSDEEKRKSEWVWSVEGVCVCGGGRGCLYLVSIVVIPTT
jgi:hypothetical protein